MPEVHFDDSDTAWECHACGAVNNQPAATECLKCGVSRPPTWEVTECPSLADPEADGVEAMGPSPDEENNLALIATATERIDKSDATEFDTLHAVRAALTLGIGHDKVLRFARDSLPTAVRMATSFTCWRAMNWKNQQVEWREVGRAKAQQRGEPYLEWAAAGERECELMVRTVEDLIYGAVELYVRALQASHVWATAQLNLLLDKNKLLYHAPAVHVGVMSQNNGAQYLVLEAVRQFGQHGGPEACLELLDANPWIGLGESANIISVLGKVTESSDAQLQAVTILAERVRTLEPHELRKLKTSMESALTALRYCGNKSCEQAVMLMWQDMSLRCFRTDELILRRYGLELLGNLLTRAGTFIDMDAFSIWLSENKVFEELFGERLNDKLVEVAAPLLKKVPQTEATMDRMFAAMSRTCVQKLLTEIMTHYEFDAELLKFSATRLAQILAGDGSPHAPGLGTHALTLTHSLLADGSTQVQYRRESLLRKNQGHAAWAIIQLLWKAVLSQREVERRLLLLAAITAALQMDHCKPHLKSLCDQCVTLVEEAEQFWDDLAANSGHESSMEVVAEHTSEATTELFTAILDAVPEKPPPPKFHHTESYVDELGMTKYKSVFLPSEELLRAETISALAEKGLVTAMLNELRGFHQYAQAAYCKNGHSQAQLLCMLTGYRQRLRLIAYVHLHSTLSFDISQLEALWSLFEDTTDEVQDQFYCWLRMQLNNPKSVSIFSTDVMLHALEKMSVLAVQTKRGQEPQPYHCLQVLFVQANCQAGSLIATCGEADVPAANKFVGVPPPPHLRGTLMIGQRVAVSIENKGFRVGTVVGYNQWWKKHNIRFGMNEETQIELSKAKEWHLLPKEEEALAGPVTVDATKKVDLQGLEGIWACAMRANGEGVATAAAELLIAVYHGMSQIESHDEPLDGVEESVEVPEYEIGAEIDLQLIKSSYIHGNYFEWKNARVVAVLNGGKAIRLEIEDGDPDEIVDLTTQHLDGFTEDSKRGPRLAERDTFSVVLPGINKYDPPAVNQSRGMDCRGQLQTEILERLMLASQQRSEGWHEMALRCLKMLKRHFVAFQSHLKECSHGSNSRGQGVHLLFKRMDGSTKRLRVHSKMTAQELHQECCKLFDMVWDWELTLNKKYYNDPNAVLIPDHSQQTLEEFGIVDGSKEYEISATINSTAKSGQDTFSPMDVFVSENGEKKHYLLMDLLGAGADDEMRGVAWELLQILPTCHALRAKVEQQPDEGQWTSVFGPTQGYWHSVYMLQIIDSLLLPAGNRAEELEKAKRWRQGFMHSGGFATLYDFLMQLQGVVGWDNVPLMRELGLSIVLRTFTFCITGMLQKALSPQSDDKSDDLDEQEAKLVRCFSSNSSDCVGDMDFSAVIRTVVSLMMQAHESQEHHLAHGAASPLAMARLSQAIVSGTTILQAILRTQQQLLGGFLEVEGLPGMMSSLLLSANGTVRKAVYKTLLDISQSSDIAHARILELLSGMLSEVSHSEGGCCFEFFDMITSLVTTSVNHEQCSLLLGMVAGTLTSPSLVPATDANSAVLIIGLLTLMGKLVDHSLEMQLEALRIPVSPAVLSSCQPAFSNPQQPAPEGSAFALYMLYHFLLEIPIKKGQSKVRCPAWLASDRLCAAQAMCQTSQSRSCAAQLLRKLLCTSKDAQNATVLAIRASVVSELINLIEVTPAPLKRQYIKDQSNWGFVEDMEYCAAVDETNTSVCKLRNMTGCVGLINRGNTCYMNSVLQQLFNLPTLRQAFLEVRAPIPLPPPEPEAAEELETVSIPAATAMPVGPVCELWVCSACTFQNESFLDQCDMCMSAKTADCEIISSNPMGTDVTTAAPDATSAPDPVKQKNRDKGAVLREVQRLFYHLLRGKAGCYEPYPLVQACSVLPLQFAVTSQNDFAEFYDHLLDVLQDQMKGTPQVKSISECMGGGIVKQRFCHKCHNLTTSSKEPFLRLELGCLQNMIPTNTLDECLNERFSSEEMTGDNQVFCGFCNKNTDTTFMDTIETLPPNLLIHLKRFSFDLETFMPKKLMHRIEFEHELDMWAYTKAGQAARLADLKALQQEELVDEAAEGAENNEDEAWVADELDDEGLQKDADTTELDGANAADDEPDAVKPAVAEVIDMGETQYKLQGVIVHRGHSAGGGHYYSFIKSSTRANGENVWLKFNDDRVSKIDPHSPTEGLDAECFGGQEEYVDNFGYTETRDKDAQALALIYRRIDLPPLEYHVDKPGSSGSLTGEDGAPIDEGEGTEGEPEGLAGFKRTRSSTINSSNGMARALSVPSSPGISIDIAEPDADADVQSQSVPATFGLDRAMSAPSGQGARPAEAEAQWESWRGHRLKEMMKDEVEQWGTNLQKQSLLFSEGVLDLGLGLCQDAVSWDLKPNTEIVTMGSLLFFDVCLRHRNQPQLKEWRDSLLQLYEKDVTASAWFLSQIVGKPESGPEKMWLEKLGLYHPDKNVRHAMCSVLRNCVSRVLLDHQGQIPAAVAELVGMLLQQFQVATSTAIGIEAYCTIWGTLAAVDKATLRLHLLDKDVAAYLLHLYLEEASPAKDQLPELEVLDKKEDDSFSRSLHVVQQLLASVQSESDVTPLTLQLLTCKEFIRKVVETDPDQLADNTRPLLRLMLSVAGLSCEDVVQLLLSSLKPGPGATASSVSDKMQLHRKDALLACAGYVGLHKLLSPMYVRARDESLVPNPSNAIHALFLLQVANSAAAIDLTDPELGDPELGKLNWYREEEQAWIWAVEWLAVETNPRNQAMITGMDTNEARQCFQLLSHVKSLVEDPSEESSPDVPEEICLQEICLRVEGAGQRKLNTVFVFQEYDTDGFGKWEATVDSIYGRQGTTEEMYVYRVKNDDGVQWHIGVPSTAYKGGCDRKYYTSKTMTKDSLLQLPCKDGWKKAMTDMGQLPAPQVSMVRMCELMKGDEEEDQFMACTNCGHRTCISKWYRTMFNDFVCPNCSSSVDFPDKQLFEAAGVNDVDTMKPLLESGECWIDRAHDPDHRTALHNAARNGHVEAVKLLIEYKCLVDPKAGDWTPLMNAAYHGSPDKNQQGCHYEEVTELLLSAGANMYLAADSRTAQQWAAYRRNQGILDVFERHTDPNAQSYPMTDFSTHHNPL